MAIPPTMRHAMNQEKAEAQPVRMEESANSSAAEQQHFFAAQAAACFARDERADKAADKRATVGPADKLLGAEMKVDFVKRLGAADDDPVVAEEQPAHGGDEGYAANIARMNPGR